LAVIALFAVAALPCIAAEVAVLRNGFSIRHERREIVGDTTRLYVTADGASFVDVPTAEIEHFEAAPELPAFGSGSADSAVMAKSPLLANYARNGAPDLDDVVNAASGRYRLDPDLVNSVIKAESGFNARAVSPKGARGLMQLMPGTASQLGVPNAFDPQANVEGGTKYLRELLERYDFDLVKALAAYNAGPQRVEQFGGVPPYYETRVYVARIVRDFNKKKAQEKAVSGSSQKHGAAKPGSKRADASSHKTQESNLAQAKNSTAQAQ
jgi:soluble lytic murein transglycosylase-like protein